MRKRPVKIASISEQVAAEFLELRIEDRRSLVNDEFVDTSDECTSDVARLRPPGHIFSTFGAEERSLNIERFNLRVVAQLVAGLTHGTKLSEPSFTRAARFCLGTAGRAKANGYFLLGTMKIERKP